MSCPGRFVLRSFRGYPLTVLANGETAPLVVAKLDRLARSVHDFACLVRIAEREGWGIVALDLDLDLDLGVGVDMTTPTGGLLANGTASVAEWEPGSLACARPNPWPRGRRRVFDLEGPGTWTQWLRSGFALVGPRVPPCGPSQTS